MTHAKHINPRTNSSVTYYDLARTIDGGADATPEQKAALLLGACGGNGGMMGVTVDASDPAYNTPGYLSNVHYQRVGHISGSDTVSDPEEYIDRTAKLIDARREDSGCSFLFRVLYQGLVVQQAPRSSQDILAQTQQPGMHCRYKIVDRQELSLRLHH
ncbi:hypothetical protein VTI74DRAFT_6666 [Chaetomium olivicolor]